MARDWDKLAGEVGAEVPTSRLSRALRLGGVGLGVAGSALGRGLTRRLVPRSADKRAAATERALKRQAAAIVRVLGRLKGASMKIGQILSSDPDLASPELSAALASLQMAAPPMPYTTVKAQIERAFDRPIEAVFATFDPTPIGAASIGQVHRGTLRDGSEVAVKVQYPGIRKTLKADLANLRSLMALGRAFLDKGKLDAYVAECEKAVLEEADYLAEGQNLARFHGLLADRDGLRAPRPYLQWTTPDVLTMALAPGVKIDEALLAAAPETRDMLAERFVESYLWMTFELGELHADPHPGNWLVDASGELVMLDLGCVKRLPAAMTDDILGLLADCWNGDHDGVARRYQTLGFGRTNASERAFDAQLLADYHAIVLEPFLTDAAFDFGSWRPATAARGFILRHPRMLRLAPPTDTLLLLRVASGVKGLLATVDARVNVRRLVDRIIARKGAANEALAGMSAHR